MELISQKDKKIMEDCKLRARDAGLSFDDETLEYIVTNRDMLNLSPKIMIPTLYDYWVQDLEAIRGKNVYDVFPHNPYETVINTRPAISFYNDNNPDWLNVMIFYHVLAHIDVFQNNVFFEKTWEKDFCNQALSDKRCIAGLREEMGEKKRWVDYIIEFSRALDNLVGYHAELNNSCSPFEDSSERFGFYFGQFLKDITTGYLGGVRIDDYHNDLKRYNELVGKHGERLGEDIFFQEVSVKHLEFPAVFKRFKETSKKNLKSNDILAYLINHSPVLNKVGRNIDNSWMKEVMGIVRNTSLYFQPQIRTKIVNEGWASYWHRALFMTDKRVSGHEIDFAYVDSKVLSMPRVGINPYAVGCRLFDHIEEMGDKGKLSYDFQLIKNIRQREKWDMKTGCGKNAIFNVRKMCDDYSLISLLPPDDFQDFVSKNKLFVVGKKVVLGQNGRPAIQYFIKSKQGEDYRKMLLDSLYHPPNIGFREDHRGIFCLNHKFEGKTLVTQYIPAVLMGLSYLWGKTVTLETTEFDVSQDDLLKSQFDPKFKPKVKKVRVIYIMDSKRNPPLMKKVVDKEEVLK